MNMKKAMKCLHFASLHAALAENYNDAATELLQVKPELCDLYARKSERSIRHANRWMDLMKHFTKAGAR